MMHARRHDLAFWGGRVYLVTVITSRDTPPMTPEQRAEFERRHRLGIVAYNLARSDLEYITLHAVPWRPLTAAEIFADLWDGRHGILEFL